MSFHPLILQAPKCSNTSGVTVAIMPPGNCCLLYFSFCLSTLLSAATPLTPADDGKMSYSMGGRGRYLGQRCFQCPSQKYDVWSVVCGCITTPRLPAVVDMHPTETIRPDGRNQFMRPYRPTTSLTGQQMVSTVIYKSSTIACRCPAGEGYGQTQTKEGRQAKIARIECEHFQCRDSIKPSPSALTCC